VDDLAGTLKVPRRMMSLPLSSPAAHVEVLRPHTLAAASLLQRRVRRATAKLHRRKLESEEPACDIKPLLLRKTAETHRVSLDLEQVRCRR